MYKCYDCGHIFEDGEQRVVKEDHGLPGGFYERFSQCPVCGGDYDEAHYCADCGKPFLEDELFSGRCEDCLDSAIDYDTAINYLSDMDKLPDFVFKEMMLSSVPRYCSATLIAALYEWCLRQKANDMILKKQDFLMALKSYILTDGRCYFGEWLDDNRKGVK